MVREPGAKRKVPTSIFPSLYRLKRLGSPVCSFHCASQIFILPDLRFNQHNDIIVLMVPSFNAEGNLPPGVHLVSWPEVCQAFGHSPRRQTLLKGLREAIRSLKSAHCQMLYLDGSFVTDKEAIYGREPEDFDGCWDPVGVLPTLLDPVLLDFSNKRVAQKAKFGGELFPSTFLAAPLGPAFLEFFQIDKTTGAAKGILCLNLPGLAESELDAEPIPTPIRANVPKLGY